MHKIKLYQVTGLIGHVKMTEIVIPAFIGTGSI